MEVFIDDCAKPSVYALFCDETELELLISGLEGRGDKELGEALITGQILYELRRVQAFPALLKKQAD